MDFSLFPVRISALGWHLTAVIYSLYLRIKEEENKPPAGVYDISTLPQPNVNAASQYPGADPMQYPGVATVPIYPNVDAAPPYPYVSTAPPQDTKI